MSTEREAEPSLKRPRTISKAEWLNEQREDKENKRHQFFNTLLEQHDKLAQDVLDALKEEGLDGESDETTNTAILPLLRQ